jgi:hypothetical protein
MYERFMKRLTLAEAFKILDTPPEIVDHFFFEDRFTWSEFRKLHFPYSGIEYWQKRLHSIHGTTEWEVG